ncbi:hypothetical protein [Aquimarina litoralis]|uniref:hypothetical protein n=1 Tax=Aquimarina litoralis TaxID=584605 RepID=UPI001C5A3857|nr:hypothetical protein [Aquimarina litoralis]MBW1297905.1 hypothetical protein [Aquimarina litoralis]
MKESILKNITQVILIVFSVVLGLYLSERIEDKKNEKEATKLLSKIKSELVENKKLLDYWVPYHKEMIKSLDSLSGDQVFIKNFIKDKATLYKVFTRNTIMGETPANDAWDIAKSHPLIVNFEYDELLILSKIYKQQGTTYESFPRMIDLLLSADLNAKENARANLELFKNQLQDITSREFQLISYYNQAETILKYQNK